MVKLCSGTMLPPQGNAFDLIFAAKAKLSKKPAGIRISFALWDRIELLWSKSFDRPPGEFFLDERYKQQILGVPCLVDLALLGESYVFDMEAE